MKFLKVLVFSLLLLGGGELWAKTLIRVSAIGSSPKGQFVAFEEFGYKDGERSPFSRIRIMNMWKSKFVDLPVQVIGSEKKDDLEQVRTRAKGLAAERFKKFNIST